MLLLFSIMAANYPCGLGLAHYYKFVIIIA